MAGGTMKLMKEEIESALAGFGDFVLGTQTPGA